MANLAMYILVNSDIKMSKGKVAGQVGHAVCSYMYHKAPHEKDLINIYMASNQTKVILSCSEFYLHEFEKQGFVTIRDAGKTELEPNTLTCVNIGIVDKDNNFDIQEFLSKLKLYH
jgi:PTH2 family peptidyl-tRNA hydrolase